MDWEIRIPTGETFSGYESKEIGEYRKFSGARPLFDKGPDTYFSENIGPDWLSVLRAQHKALSYVKENALKGIPASHEISFRGREGSSYVFESDIFYDDGCDPGSVKETIRVTQVGSVIREEEDNAPEELLSGLARIGKWMYKHL